MKLPELIESLKPRKVFFSAGARNAPLIPLLEKYKIEFGSDDRSLAFKAMGMAKVTNESVIICTTSGTAVAEVMPAMIEAYFSQIPLILIAADRPNSLNNSWAPQMIDQRKFMNLYSRDSVDADMDEDFPVQKPIQYPVFLNVRVNLEQVVEKKVRYAEVFPDEINFNQTLFIINSRDKSLVEKVLNKIEGKSCYIYQEIKSSHHSIRYKNEILYDEMLQRTDDIKQIVRIGSCPNSKYWRKIKDIPLYHIDPSNRPTHYYGTVLTNHKKSIDQILNFDFDSFSPECLYDYQPKIESIIKESKESEINQIDQILNKLPESKIFWGNSMPIRYAKFFKTKHENLSSRGANGIDGLVSTAIGIAQGTDLPVFAIIGDLSFEYDISALFNEWPANLKLLILNNGGGRIFDRIKANSKIVNEHERTYESVIRSFGLKYGLWNQELDIEEKDVIEVKVNNKQTEAFWSSYNDLLGGMV